MSGDFTLENQCLPLVDRTNGKYTKYVDKEESDGVFSLKSGMSVGERLTVREKLLKRRQRIVDVQLAMALLGFILMLVENEMYFLGYITKSSTMSVVLKSLVSLSTVVLLAAIIVYHMTEIKLRMTENHLNDWRLVVTFPYTYFQIFLELMICFPHPLPFDTSFRISGLKGQTVYASSDALMSILMILRSYLIGRMLVVHNKFISGTATQGLGALNKVKIDAFFLFKALMSSNPGSVLIVLMIFILLVNSWAMRTCETFYQLEKDNSDYWNMMWMVSVTFLTIGYGDLYPVSLCGRFVSVATGLMGVGTTALLITVLAHKLEQTRAEKYVYNFVMRAQRDKEKKMAAADVIKNWIHLCRLRRCNNVIDDKQIRVHGKLQQAIRVMREARNQQDSIGESTIGFIEISKVIRDVEQKTEAVQQSMKDVKNELLQVQRTSRDLQLKLHDIHQVLVFGHTK
ncbi:small conductance calcium-activated potassium channel protein 2-like [Ostrea edulis]|uniref:small conductance calcium-activated potassium channel protein 2-like n=1 Tax=Ostrea edulis TaxID=37623 RepID=UPI002095AEC2|nr:small conductance calcium-activated potassium channel protein 2-like [Ostrea edulis]